MSPAKVLSSISMSVGMHSGRVWTRLFEVSMRLRLQSLMMRLTTSMLVSSVSLLLLAMVSVTCVFVWVLRCPP